MTAELRIPGPVRPGARIRIISPTAPSAILLPDRAGRGESALRARGFTVDYGRRARKISPDGATAGDARLRAADLQEAFEDPSVDAVLCADAGEGSIELLDHLDARVLARHPKPFIGFCDNGVINHFLLAESGLSSLYGCTLIAQLGETGGAFPETMDYLVRALDSSRELVCEPVGARTAEWINWYVPSKDAVRRRRCVRGGWNWLTRGRATGPLVGGEVVVVPWLARRFGLSLDGAVVFWHVATKGAEPEVTFRQMCESADLTGVAAMIVGAHPEIPPAQWAARVADMLDELLPDLGCPVVVNTDISHLGPCWTVPYGEEVTLDPDGAIVFGRTPAATAGTRAAGRP